MCHPVGRQTYDRFIYVYLEIICKQYPVPQSCHTRSHTHKRNYNIVGYMSYEKFNLCILRLGGGTKDFVDHRQSSPVLIINLA